MLNNCFGIVRKIYRLDNSSASGKRHCQSRYTCWPSIDVFPVWCYAGWSWRLVWHKERHSRRSHSTSCLTRLESHNSTASHTSGTFTNDIQSLRIYIRVPWIYPARLLTAINSGPLLRTSRCDSLAKCWRVSLTDSHLRFCIYRLVQSAHNNANCFRSAHYLSWCLYNFAHTSRMYIVSTSNLQIEMHLERRIASPKETICVWQNGSNADGYSITSCMYSVIFVRDTNSGNAVKPSHQTPSATFSWQLARGRQMMDATPKT